MPPVVFTAVPRIPPPVLEKSRYSLGLSTSLLNTSLLSRLFATPTPAPDVDREEWPSDDNDSSNLDYEREENLASQHSVRKRASKPEGKTRYDVRLDSPKRVQRSGKGKSHSGYHTDEDGSHDALIHRKKVTEEKVSKKDGQVTRITEMPIIKHNNSIEKNVGQGKRIAEGLTEKSKIPEVGSWSSDDTGIHEYQEITSEKEKDRGEAKEGQPYVENIVGESGNDAMEDIVRVPMRSSITDSDGSIPTFSDQE